MEFTALEQQLKDYHNSAGGLAVVIVLNCSNSMQSHLILERLAAREIVDRLVKEFHNYVALIQFGNTVEMLQDFTLDYNKVGLQLVGLKPVGGNSPNLRAALVQAQTSFILLGKMHRKLVVVLTDCGSAPAVECATKMKAENIEVVCLGIGPRARNDDLMALASSINHYYALPSMDELPKLFKAPASASFVEPLLEKARVYENAITFVLDFKMAGVLHVDFQQHNGEQWTTLYSKSIPSLKETSTVLQCKDLKPQTEYTFRALIKLQSGLLLTSSTVTITTRKSNPFFQLLSNPEKLGDAVNKLKLKISNFSQQFPYLIRIGLVGKVGNGKSSVTNSIYAIFNGEFEFYNVTGVLGEKSLTTHPMPVPIPNTKLQLLDFFGWDNPNQYESDLKYLIQGLALDTLTEGQTLSPSFKATTDGQHHRRFYGVFIIVSPAEVAQAQHLAYVQGLYDFISRQGLQPIILLTKCDQIDSDLVENPELIYSSDLVDDYIQQLTSKKFPRGIIFPVITYFEPPHNGQLNTVKDYLLLSALFALLFSSMKPILKDIMEIQGASEPINGLSNSVQRLSIQPPRDGSQNGSPQALHASNLPPDNLADSQRTELSRSQNPSHEVDVPPQVANNGVPFAINARRNAGNETAFKRCSLATKDMDGLQKAISKKFALSSMPFKIHELKNGIKVDIDDDQDVAALAHDAILEFNA